MRRNFAAAFAVMLASAGLASTGLVLAPAPAFSQVSDKTDFQVQNLLRAGYELETEMLKADDAGCVSESMIKAFEARIQRLSDERDSLTLRVPDFVNYYPNRIPWESPSSLLSERIYALRQTLSELQPCDGQLRSHYGRRWRNSSFLELSLAIYVIGLNRADQTSIETLRLTDIQKLFKDFDDPAGVGFAASYLFAPWNNALRVGPFASASWQISGHPVTLFVQYQHTWWNTANFYAPASSPAFDYAFKREDDTLKLGVNVYFGAASPAPPSSPTYPVKAIVSK